MLRQELKDADIPHRTTIRQRILEIWDEHLVGLESDMANAIGKISFTMDMWSDPNLTPYMAITAHWIEARIEQTSNGPQHMLTLRADLAGFTRVPGHHSGEHLAKAFMFVLGRIKVLHKIGWVTLDNASNNDTFMLALQRELHKLNIPFDTVQRRIRCFPHVVNLACKVVLAAITDLKFAQPESADFIPDSQGSTSLRDAIGKDPIAITRTLVRTIRASSLRRQYFSEVTKTLKNIDLQLLRDVDTRWSSTLLMMERTLILREAIERFLENNDFKELRKYQLDDNEWKALEVFREILAVPHAFQQKLSAEKTPTLCNAIPYYDAMMRVWEKHQYDHPATSHVIDQGLDKLESYITRASLVPAYILAMIINPAIKLKWYRKYEPAKLEAAKVLFISELRVYYQEPDTRHKASSELDRNTSQRAWADSVLDLDDEDDNLPGQNVESEVAAYLADSQTGTGLLTYWQENQLRYPTIFSLAMDILPIQGSAVPCKRVFSSSKETTTARRNRIGPELMEALQMLKYSFKKGRGLDFTAGTGRDAELEELAFAGQSEDRGGANDSHSHSSVSL